MEREKLFRLLRLGLEKGASDIHFQVGYLPLYRFHGDLVELRYKVLTSKDTEEIAQILIENDPGTTDGEFNERDLAFELPDLGRFRVNISRQRRFYNIVLAPAAGIRARHRRHRNGQVHHAGGHDRRDQSPAEGEDRDGGGPDRIRLYPRQEHHHPA
jgi:hypothetical protein